MTSRDGGRGATVLAVATGASLVILGVCLAVVGLLMQPVRPAVFGVAAPVGLLVAAANYGAARLAWEAFPRWWAPLLPLSGWLAVVLPTLLHRPGGDHFVAYDDVSLVFLAVGVFAAFVGVSVATPVSDSGR